MREKLNLKNLSKFLSIIGFMLAAFSTYKIVKVRASLPPGVCPVDNQRGFLFLSIFLLLSSLALDLFLEKKKKR